MQTTSITHGPIVRNHQPSDPSAASSLRLDFSKQATKRASCARSQLLGQAVILASLPGNALQLRKETPWTFLQWMPKRACQCFWIRKRLEMLQDFGRSHVFKC
jgi:hypothetical protein